VDLGKPISIITTIDISHNEWLNETIPVMSDILKENNIKAEEVHRITADFSSISPPAALSGVSRGLIFYDIHDLPGKSLINLFFENWIKDFHGTIMFHDVSIVHPSYVHKSNQFSSNLFSGERLCGFREVIPLVDFLNRKNISWGSVSKTSIVRINL
jgi:hypothetical protein